MKKKLLFFAFFCLSAFVYANNISVSNVTLTGQNTTSDYTLVQFDLSWDNSWRTSSQQSNWDAAWVFIKFRKKSSTVWNHGTINSTGHTEASGSSISVGSDGVGVFIYRSSVGSGSNTFASNKLRWNYGTDGLLDTDSVEVNVIAIEMVYVPQGSFYIGSGGTETGAFYKYPNTNTPYQITSEGAITVGTSTDNLYYPLSTYSGDQSGPIPADFPKGYNAFYCMKYLITQGQYVDFLNKLTRTQQASRVRTNVAAGQTSITNRFVLANSSSVLDRNGIACNSSIHTSNPITFYCDLDNDGTGNESNDGADIACGYLSYKDLIAYLDWAGLRPITELEHEKACRGTLTPVANEYVWGSTQIQTSAYTLTNSGENSEAIATNYSTTKGNIISSSTIGSIGGPLRAGIFASNVDNSGRVTSGATYYGIMEMGGMIFSRLITVGNTTGRAYTGVHGNGVLDSSGDADATLWPTSTGSGHKQGSWRASADFAKISQRQNVTYSGVAGDATVRNDYGGRGVRIAP